MKITNTTKSDLGLSPDVVVPAGGSLDIENEALTALKASPVVKAWLIDGWLVETGAVDAVDQGADIDDARFDVLAGVIRGLAPEGFTNSGKPDVGAINAVLPKTSARVNASERDAVWAQMQVA